MLVCVISWKHHEGQAEGGILHTNEKTEIGALPGGHERKSSANTVPQAHPSVSLMLAQEINFPERADEHRRAEECGNWVSALLSADETSSPSSPWEKLRVIHLCSGKQGVLHDSGSYHFL